MLSRLVWPIWLICLTVLCLLLGGYVYGVDDHETDLSIVHRILDPAYLPNDWYLNAHATIDGPRYVYAAIIAATASIVPLPLACAGWYALLLTLLLGGVCHIGWTLHRRRSAALLAAAAASLTLANQSAGLGYAFWSNAIISQCFASTIAVWAYAIYLRGRVVAALALAAGGCWIHGQAGNQCLAVLLLLAWIECRGRLRTVCRATVLAAAIAAPINIHFLLSSGLGVSTEQLMSHLALRLPHHYDPSAWPAHQVLAVLAAAALIVFHRAPAAPKSAAPKSAAPAPVAPAAAESLRRLTVILLTLSLIYVVSFQLWPCAAVLKADFARHASVLVFIAAAVLGGALSRPGAVVRVDWWRAAAALWLCALPVHGGLAYVGALIRPATLRARWLRGAAPAGMLLLAAAWNLKWPAGAIHCLAACAALAAVAAAVAAAHAGRRWRIPPFVTASAVCLAGALLLHPDAAVEWRTRGALHGLSLRMRGPQNETERLAIAAGRVTPPDAILVLPPITARAGLLSNRATVVSFKSNPHRLAFIGEWTRRLRDCADGRSVAGLPALEQSSLVDAYAAMTTAGLARLGQAYGATHAIIPPTAADDQLTTLAEDHGWRLVSIPRSTLLENALTTSDHEPPDSGPSGNEVR